MARSRTKKYSPHILPPRKDNPNLKVPVSVIYTYANFRPPSDRESKEALLKEYIEWSFTTTSTNPIDFPLEKRINPHHFFNLAKEEPLFADMIEFVKYKFASQLENNPKVSGDYTAKRIRYYDREYGDWVRSEITQAIKAHSDIKVVMDSIPTTNLVPQRKTNDSD